MLLEEARETTGTHVDKFGGVLEADRVVQIVTEVGGDFVDALGVFEVERGVIGWAGEALPVSGRAVIGLVSSAAVCSRSVIGLVSGVVVSQSFSDQTGE